MSHAVGTLVSLGGSPFNIGAAYGGPNNTNFPHTPPAPADGPTRFIILHIENAVFPGSSRLEVNLGYATGELDVFDASSGTDFWTRPINVSSFTGGNIPIFFIPDGAGGGVQITEYGRGERHVEDIPGGSHDSYSNCDPFLVGVDGADNYVEPDYDPYWLCHSPPHWDNIENLPSGDVRRTVAESVGMLVSIHGNHVSTCSATLIGNDLVISAAHCIDQPSDIAPMSVIFNYQTTAGGGVPGGYSPVFHKVTELVHHGPLGDGGTLDYMVIRINIPSGGLGISPIPIRNTRPAVGENVFGVHHPNGAVKKLSPSIADGFATVFATNAPGYIQYFADHIPTQFDVTGGTSGSGLFDSNGHFVGVLSVGQGGPFAPQPADRHDVCFISYATSYAILNHIAAGVVPSPARDVMLVFDRSGSMSQTMSTGLTKLEEAKNAAALFIRLTRTENSDQIGLVTFSSDATATFNLDDVNAGNKDTLIGDSPPFTNGIVGGISAGGSTSIGDGLAMARDQMNLHGIDGNQRTIFLLTDGLQNTPAMVETIEGSLINTDIFAVGYGSESGLNGTLLTELAENHNGLYMRAGSGLGLLKFFALTFGNIFEAGTLSDPEYVLPAEVNESNPLTFQVCEETSITVVLGWEKPNIPLLLQIETPGGNIISFSEQGITFSSGRTWRFARIELPHQGEHNGAWKVQVLRITGGEFPPPAEEVSYFLNVIAKDGPRILLRNRKRRYYTGEDYNPLVAVMGPDGFRARHASVQLTVIKPINGTGNILSNSKFDNQIGQIDGDVIPARNAALKQIEAGMEGQPLIQYEEVTFELKDGSGHGDGAMEPDGIFGRMFPDLFQQEGHYTFRAVATYGEDCTGSRETVWTVNVVPGIDPDLTNIVTEVLDNFAGGINRVRITLTPKDKYGNLLGPGRLDMLDLQAIPGSVITGLPSDQGDGTYVVVVDHDLDFGNQPGVIIIQPQRVPVVVTPASNGPSEQRFPFWLFWLLVLIILLLLILLFLT